jgi:hypothetical protein
MIDRWKYILAVGAATPPYMLGSLIQSDGSD